MENPDQLQEQVHTLAGQQAFHVCPTCGLKLSLSTKTCPNDGTETGESPKPGTIFKGHYEFVDIVGEGGMSVVYKARDKLLGRTVAIKLMHAHVAANSKQILRFQQEAKAASLLSHPHVISVHEFGTLDDGQPFLIMDYAEGKSLAEIIAGRGRLPVARALAIFVQVADALSHAHRKNVIHRDLKPSNIMLCRGDRGEDVAKVVDFGIAKIVQSDADKRGLTQTGEIFGSPPYMSPEQCAGWPMNNRSDIYSMGCLMYEALSGHPPFTGESLVETVYKHMHEPPPQLVAEGEKFPEMLQMIVTKTLAKEPGERYETMEQLRADLQHVLDDVEGRDNQAKYICNETSAPTTFKIPWVVVGGAILVIVSALFATLSLPTAPPPKGNKVQASLEQVVAQSGPQDSMLSNQSPSWSGDDNDLKELIKTNPNVTELPRDGKPLTDAGFIDIAKMKYLHMVSLCDTEVTNATMKRLGAVSSLKTLRVARTTVNDNGIKALAGLDLRELDVSNTGVTRAALPTIAGFKNLEVLNVSGLNLTDADLVMLAQLPSLHDLTISGNHITGPGLARLRSLKRLVAGGNPLDDEGIPFVVQLPILEVIDLSDTPITEKGGVLLGAKSNLVSVTLNKTLIGDKTARELVKLPGLKVLSLDETKVTRALIPALVKSKSIVDLSLHKDGLDNASAALISTMGQLQVLNVGGSQIDDAGAKKLANLSKLKDLSLDHTLITDASMPALVGKLKKQLQSLNISGTIITNKGVRALSEIDGLADLKTADCRGIDDDGLQDVKHAHPYCHMDRGDAMF